MITLDPDTKSAAIASLRRYFAEELDQEIGDLKADLLLGFLLKEIGPSIHNAAVRQAAAYLVERAADLENAAFEPEFAYWPRARGG